MNNGKERQSQKNNNPRGKGDKSENRKKHDQINKQKTLNDFKEIWEAITFIKQEPVCGGAGAWEQSGAQENLWKHNGSYKKINRELRGKKEIT